MGVWILTQITALFACLVSELVQLERCRIILMRRNCYSEKMPVCNVEFVWRPVLKK